MPSAIPIAAVGTNEATALVGLGVVLLTLAILGRVSTRFGISPIPLYILGGLAFGWFFDDRVSEPVTDTGEVIGVVLLLFMLGLEYTGADLTRNLRTSARPGAVDLILNATPGFAMGTRTRRLRRGATGTSKRDGRGNWPGSQRAWASPGGSVGGPGLVL